MSTPLKILMLEDNPSDADMIQRLLKKQYPNCQIKLEMAEGGYLKMLEEFTPDIVISDNEMPQFSAAEALAILQARKLLIPFILVTGTVSEEFAVDIIKAGADDYILKDRLTRLPSAIERALKQKQTEQEKFQAAQHLVESEEKYRVLVEQASDAIFIADGSGRFLTVNSSACKLSQYSEEELLQMTVHDFLLDANDNVRPAMFAELKNGQTMVTERRIRRKDGSVKYVDITSKMLTDGRLLAFVRDISERKKAEESIVLSNERYNLVSKATNDSIWDFDILTGAIVRTGDGFKSLFGYSTDAIPFDKLHWMQLIHPDDLPYVQESLDDVFKNTKEAYWEQEYRFLKADGKYAFVYDKGYIIRDGNGNAIRMIGAMQDVTRLKENEIHLKELNENLRIQAKALTESNAELEQFAYVASHDLQEPLRMVTSFLSLLETRYKNLIDEDGRKYIYYAVDGASRMRQIILDLLEFSRVGRNIGHQKQVDLNLLVHDIELLLLKQVQENGATIKVNPLPVINSYETPLRQVFQNLISNALNYSKQNVPAVIEISCNELPQHWQFTVADNGIGIDKEYFDKIFVIFQRLHNKNEYSGTGIGLSITKKIVETLGGKIWLQSQPGVGSSFYFTILK